MTGWNDPEVKSATEEEADFNLSIDLGVKTTSGLLGLVNACLRSRWKCEAGVLG